MLNIFLGNQRKTSSIPFISLEKLCDNLVAGYDLYNSLILLIKDVEAAGVESGMWAIMNRDKIINFVPFLYHFVPCACTLRMCIV